MQPHTQESGENQRNTKSSARCDTFMEQMKIIPKKNNDAPPLESFDF